MANDKVVINGTDIVAFADGDVLAHSTSHTLSISMNTRETSNKDTGKFNTKAPARLDVQATTEALVVYTDFADIAGKMIAREPIPMAFGERTAEDNLDETKFYAEGDFIITSLEQNAGDQENASYSATFEHYENFALSGDVDLRAGIAKTNTSSAEADDGFAAVLPRGGTAPYTFQWDDVGNSTTQAIEGLAAGTYKCTITDDDGTVVQRTVVITEPE